MVCSKPLVHRREFVKCSLARAKLNGGGLFPRLTDLFARFKVLETTKAIRLLDRRTTRDKRTVRLMKTSSTRVFVRSREDLMPCTFLPK